jgi:threonine dehydrogenase-like Zn-dependent dehydrogenase
MKAAVFNKKMEMNLIEKDLNEELEEKQVLVKIKACGVCGTDVHIYKGSDGSAEVTPPVILGHEFSGIVEKVGSGVTSLAVGDHVSIDPNDMCGVCTPCLEGKAQFCKNLEATGVTMDGGFAEKVIVKEKQAYKINKSVSFEDAALIESVSCCLHAVDIMDFKAGEPAVIIGGGAIGMIMIQLLRYSGASKIILSDPLKEKRDLALELGANIVVDPINENLAEKITKEGQNIDDIKYVVECVGLPATTTEAINIAGFGATVMLFGVSSPTDQVPINMFNIFKKELKITSSFINPYTFNRAISLVESGNIVLNKLYCKVDLDRIVEVFEKELYRDGKIIITNK